jgi:hypothetical protein
MTKINIQIEERRRTVRRSTDVSKRPLAKEELRYGDDGTIHRTGHLDVEVDNYGKVVAVWFRCMPLPFEQSHAEPHRALDMNRMYSGASAITDKPRKIKAVVLEN